MLDQVADDISVTKFLAENDVTVTKFLDQAADDIAVTKYLAENDNYACSKQDGGQNKRDGDFQNFHVDYSKTAASRKCQQAEIHSVSKNR